MTFFQVITVAVLLVATAFPKYTLFVAAVILVCLLAFAVGYFLPTVLGF